MIRSFFLYVRLISVRSSNSKIAYINKEKSKLSFKVISRILVLSRQHLKGD